MSIPSKHLVDLGFVADPLDVSVAAADGGLTRLATHAAAMRFVGALEVAASGSGGRIAVIRDAAIPMHYHHVALADAFKTLAGRTDLAILACHVSMPAMRTGRIRSSLSAVVERVSGFEFDVTLAAWAKCVLADIDTTLPEAVAFDGVDLPAFIARIEDDPKATMAELFGTCVMERAGRAGIDEVMQDTAVRRDALDVDPEEASASDEEPQPGELAADGASAPSARPQLDSGDARPTATDYLIAHARAHVSPVLARGLRAYRVHGTGALGQELRITKAPRKTLRAITEFAARRWRLICVIYDDFDSWEMIPADTRARLAGAIAEVRSLLGENGAVALMTNETEAPELIEQFSTRIDWNMPGLATLIGESPRLDPADARALLLSSMRPGEGAGVVDAVLSEAGDPAEDVAGFVERVRRSIDAMVASGARA